MVNLPMNSNPNLADNYDNENTKQFQSIFCPTILIDRPNVLAELMIANMCKLRKRPYPNSPFWRKDIAKNDPNLTELAKRYSVEVAACRNLLKKYPLSILIKYYKKSCMPGYKLLRKETRQKIDAELELMLASYEINKPTQVTVEPTSFVGIKQSLTKNKLSGL